jgi:perosamine synthetase
VIPVNRPILDGNEHQFLQECISSGWISSEGPFVERFEKSFAERVGRKFGVAVSSGTAALDIAIEMLDLSPGDEVIMPAFTIISCVHQVVRRGAIPVLVDCESDTWNMDTEQIENRISSRTKAILVVHIYGLPTDMAKVVEIANKYGLQIIEDSAEAHGLRINGVPCGSFGLASTFSFFPNKLITTGEGGMLVTDDEDIDRRARLLRNLYFGEPRYVHENLGWNYRMTNMQAAIGVAQMERWDEFLQRKNAIGIRYLAQLGDIAELQLPLMNTDIAQNVFWVFGVVLKNGIKADEMRGKLSKHGVSSRAFFCPLHLQPALRRIGMFSDQEFPVAEWLWQYGLYLPSGVGTTDDEIDESVAALRACLIAMPNFTILYM